MAREALLRNFQDKGFGSCQHGGMKTLWILLSCFAMTLGLSLTAQGAASISRCVILLHGLGRTEAAMSKMEKVLSDKGFLVWNRGYPSTEAPVAVLANVVGQGLDFCAKSGADEVFIVTHSLGGILVRAYFQNHEAPSLKGVVMLAPPNHGSEVVDHLRETSLLEKVLGPAALELGTEETSVPNSLTKPLPFPVGIIAGTESSDPWFASFFDGPNDGKVSVESTKLPEMTDFRTVPAGHTFMMRSDEAIGQVLSFLESLRFK